MLERREVVEAEKTIMNQNKLLQQQQQQQQDLTSNDYILLHTVCSQLHPNHRVHPHNRTCVHLRN